MKRILIAAIVLLVTSVTLFGQVGDARTRGMGDAMTGLADDINAMYFNPAGIGFLKKGYFTIDTNVMFGMTNRAIFGEQEYPWVYEDYNDYGEGSNYVYWDEFLGTDTFFDPADYGFPWDPDAEATSDESYENAVLAYQDFRNYYGTFETFNSLYDVGMIPRIAWQGNLIGLSTISDIRTELVVSDYRAADTEYIFEVEKDQGAMGAIGFNLGFIGVGANFKWINRTTDTITYYGDDFEFGPPEDLPTQLISGTADQSEPVNRIELGVGSLVALGPFNVGAYIDNLLFFIDYGGDTDASVDLLGLFETMSVGASWTPSDRKMAEKRGILNLIATADLKNFGSETDRVLAAGVEAGLNLGNVITVNWRGGYRQPLPGTLAEMATSFDPEIGSYSVGMGAKFLFVQLDIAAVMPADIVLDPPVQGTIPEDRMDEPFASFMINASVNF